MSREVISIKRKALRINLEGSIYGTFAEIGAGQEVARTFFQVGGASGTVAKTMSAYDMAFSDSIYGEEESGRYVSESRLNKMLTHEYELLGERLVGDEYEGIGSTTGIGEWVPQPWSHANASAAERASLFTASTLPAVGRFLRP